MLQQGKGADMGAAFGAGASQTVFGARGSANFLSRTTAILAAVFFITSLTLAYFAGQAREGVSIVDKLDGNVPVQSSSEIPAAPMSEDVPAVPVESPVPEEPAQ